MNDDRVSKSRGIEFKNFTRPCQRSLSSPSISSNALLPSWLLPPLDPREEEEKHSRHFASLCLSSSTPASFEWYDIWLERYNQPSLSPPPSRACGWSKQGSPPPPSLQSRESASSAKGKGTRKDDPIRHPKFPPPA